MVIGQTSNLAINPTLYRKLPYDPVKDLAPVVLMVSAPIILVTSDKRPYKSLAEVVAAAKAKPGQLSYGSPGNGTVAHLTAELFQRAAGIQLTHIPYKRLPGDDRSDGRTGGPLPVFGALGDCAAQGGKTARARRDRREAQRRAAGGAGRRRVGLQGIRRDDLVWPAVPAGTPEPVVKLVERRGEPGAQACRGAAPGSPAEGATSSAERPPSSPRC